MGFNMSESQLRELLSFPELRPYIGKRSRVQIWRDVRAGKFPAPVKIGPNANAWFKDEIIQFQSALQKVSYAPQEAA